MQASALNVDNSFLSSFPTTSPVRGPGFVPRNNANYSIFSLTLHFTHLLPMRTMQNKSGLWLRQQGISFLSKETTIAGNARIELRHQVVSSPTWRKGLGTRLGTRTETSRSPPPLSWYCPNYLGIVLISRYKKKAYTINSMPEGRALKQWKSSTNSI